MPSVPPITISATEFQYLSGREAGPESRQHEGRDGENRAGRHRFADRPDGSRDVLFEQRALHQPQQRHADHRRRVGGGDGHARLQAQVGVGRAQHGGHHQAEQHRAQGELAHVGLVRHVGPEFLFGLRGRHWSCDLTFSLSAFPSTVLPASLACAAFITTPICLIEVTPVSASAAAMAASISASPARGRQVGFDQRSLGLFFVGLFLAPALAEHLGGIGALLHQRLQDLHFGRFVERLLASTSCFISAAFIMRSALRRASSRAFMAATMSFCTRSSKGMMSAILKY